MGPLPVNAAIKNYNRQSTHQYNEKQPQRHQLP